MPESHTPRGRPVRVALVNDHEIVVRGLEQMLGAYDNQVTVVELNLNTQPDDPVDVALYDTFTATQAADHDIDRLLDNDWVKTTAIFTWNMDSDLIDVAREKGVRGYLSKSLTAAQLADALVRLADGEVVIEPASEVDKDTHDLEPPAGEWPGKAEGLSVRQAEVIALVTEGYSNAEIAQRTYLTLNTVKSYIRIAYRTMGVNTRSQAVRWGIEHGMLPSRAKRIDRDA